MSQPFVKFVDGKLTLQAPLDPDLMRSARVVSILGKARMGKSTFLNTIVSRLTGQNCTVFETKDTLEHCTHGIDYFYIPSHNLLLLDSQGIGHQDSSHDPALLLLIYLISDVIVFNERMMLQNEALKLLEPICAFATYIDIEEVVKPHLYFRISDGDMVKKPEENLEMLLTHYEDQYQSIRDCIRHIFNETIGIVKTDSLDKKCRAFLAEGDYLRLMLEGEIGVQEAIDEIMMSLPTTDRGPINYVLKIARVIEQINNNEKININKLDVVGKTIKMDVLEWIQNLDKGHYAAIEVDGTQECYETRVEPKKVTKKTILGAFTRTFKSVPASILTPIYKKLEADLAEPIKKAIDDSSTKAEERVAAFVRKVEEDHTLQPLHSKSISFKCIDVETFFGTYFMRYDNLLKACEVIYKPVREKYAKLVAGIYDKFFKVFYAAVKEEEEEEKQIKAYCEEKTKKFSEWIISCIPKYPELLTTTDDGILVDMQQSYMDLMRKYLLSFLSARDIKVVMKDKNLTVTCEKVQLSLTASNIHTYDLVKKHYDTICGVTTKMVVYNTEDNYLYSVLIAHKKRMLYGKILPAGSRSGQIIKINDNIQFVRNMHLDSCISNPGGTFMTQETYDDFYLPIINAAKEKLVSKGYCREEEEFFESSAADTIPVSDPIPHSLIHKPNMARPIMATLNNMKTIKIKAPTTIYLKNLQELFFRNLKKIYCQQIVNGKEFPVELSS